MERVTGVQLKSALTAAEAPLQKSLSSSDSSILLAEMERLMRRYPMQDQGETAKEFFRDYAQLALKYSLPKVRAALEALRIDPEQTFFPKPEDVAGEIERQALLAGHARGLEQTRQLLAQSEVDFWAWVGDRMAATGKSEQEILDAVKVPGFTGRKARTA